ncbi:MAG: LysE family translocator [Anaerolineae bacterium]|nr:LysE family translocator [Anaerolineae bacterium]
MDSTVLLLLAVCAVGIVILGVLLVFGLGFLRRWAPQLLQVLGGAGAVFASEEPRNKVDPLLGNHRRTNLRSKAEALDFDAALPRYRDTDVPPPADVSAQQVDTSPFDLNTKSPVSGRIMRDGRYRRVTGGTPDREQDQDFRRVDGGDSPFEAPNLPDTNHARRRRRRDRNQDELFGGQLDEDGDGELDF